MLSRALEASGENKEEAARLDSEARQLRKRIQGNAYTEDDQTDDAYHRLVPYFF